MVSFYIRADWSSLEIAAVGNLREVTKVQIK